MEILEKLQENAKNKIFTDNIETIMKTDANVYISAICDLCDILEEYGTRKNKEAAFSKSPAEAVKNMNTIDEIARQLSRIESVFDQIESKEENKALPEQKTDWKAMLKSEPIRPIINWLETKGMDLTDRQRMINASAQ